MRAVSRPADLSALTGVRAFAALAVVAFHFTEGLTLPLWLQPLTSRGYLGVDLFFILSGFIIHHVYRGAFASGAHPVDVQAFTINRFARIWPMHMFAMLAMLALYGVALSVGRQPADQSALSFTALLASILMIHAWVGLPSLNIPAWSISAEWFAYLLYPAICLQTASITTRGKAALLLGCLVAVELWANSHPLLRIMPEFVIGILLYDLRDRFPAGRFGGLVAAGALIALCYAGSMELLGLRVALFGLLIVSLSRAEDHLGAHVMSHPIAVYLGEISYSIYLIHGVVWAVAKNAVRIAPAADIGSFGLIALAIAATLAVSVAAYRWVENPSREAIRAEFSPSRSVKHPPAGAIGG